MEHRGLYEAARAAEEGDWMVTSELEAAEALAGLALGGGSGSAHLECPGQQLLKDPTLTSFSQSSQAEKEVRRHRRVLANRESARQTIRRRQAMYLELIRKVADLSEENKRLKQEKELAVKEHNSLKGRNEFLKVQVADVEKAEPREMQEEPKSARADIASSAAMSTSVFLCTQPSLVPFIWPSIAPSSNIFKMQYASPPDVMTSSRFPMRHDIPSLHQGREISLGHTEPGNPMFVLPVPWLLPFLNHSPSFQSQRPNKHLSAEQCSTSSSSDTAFVKDKHQLSSNPYMRIDASNSTRTMPVGSVCGAGFTLPEDTGDCYRGHHPKGTLLGPETLSCVGTVKSPSFTRYSQANTGNLNAVSALEHMSQGLLKKDQEPIICHQKKSEKVFAATKARRRRKELMRLKNIHSHHDHLHGTKYSASG